MSKQASKFIGSIPENYDRFLGPLIFHDFADDVAQRVLDLGPSKVLELAAGTGIVTRRLRDRLPDDCLIIATDLNPPMLDVAKSKFQSGENVHFESADATQLPYDASGFDTVACQFGVMFFPEDPPGFYQVPFGYNDATAIEKSLVDAGFSEVSIETLEITSEIPSPSEFAMGLVFGNPLFEEIISRGGEPDKVRSAVSDALERQLGGNMPLQALVIVAKKPKSD